jgi:ketosteroid isomerase-like protein
MNRREIEAFVRASYAARRANDVEAALGYFDKNVRFRIVGSKALGPMTEPVVGKNDLGVLFQALLKTWDWSNFGPETLHVDGNAVFVHCTGELCHLPSGNRCRTEVLDWIIVDKEKIVTFTEFLDTHLINEILTPPLRPPA